jgi:hypothetical protein
MTDKQPFNLELAIDQEDAEKVSRAYLVPAARALSIEASKDPHLDANRRRWRKRKLERLASDMEGIDRSIPPFDTGRLEFALGLCREFVRVVISQGGAEILDGPNESDGDLLGLARDVIIKAFT